MNDCLFDFICREFDIPCSNTSLTEAKLWCNKFKRIDKYIENKIKEMIE